MNSIAEKRLNTGGASKQNNWNQREKESIQKGKEDTVLTSKQWSAFAAKINKKTKYTNLTCKAHEHLAMKPNKEFKITKTSLRTYSCQLRSANVKQSK